MSNSQALLFDLDGTLLDTAPDLAFALNTLLIRKGKKNLPYETIRPVASHGARGLLELGFDFSKEQELYAELRDELLAIYQANICRQTTLFNGIEEVLRHLTEQQIIWGIVTNKPGYLTEPLLKHINFPSPPACIVSGDTVTKCKPYPDPLWHACELINTKPENCIYIGDAERDIEAGLRAGMKTWIASYGYLAATDNFLSWGADAVIEQPIDIISFLLK